MGFAVGAETEKLYEKAIRGRCRKVAVGCWFTASGKAIPQLVKYEDEDGCLQMLRDIQLLYSEQKYFAGILSRKYVCSTEVEGMKREFTLIYYPETNQWNMAL